MNFDTAKCTEPVQIAYSCMTCGSTDDVQLCQVDREDVDYCAECREQIWCGQCGEEHDDCVCAEEPDYAEDMDGDHETALDSVYGPEDMGIEAAE
jgi:hypothetical protein